jgi:hypothetical protein
MTNEWLAPKERAKTSDFEDDLELKLMRLEKHCIDLQDRLNEALRLDQVSQSTILKLTECCKEAADVEREACAELLDGRADALRNQANIPGVKVMDIRNLDLAALVLSDAAELIRGRK